MTITCTGTTLNKLAITATFILLITTLMLVKVPTAHAAAANLVVITPIGSTMTDPVVDAFKVWFKAQTGNDVSVSFIRGGTGELFTRIRAWAGKPDATIFWGGSLDLVDTLISEKLIFAYKIPEFDKYPAELAGIRLKDATGNFYVTSFYGLGVIYSGKLLRDKGLTPPQTWNDLLDPKYRGVITFTTPAKSGTIHNLVELFLQRKGEDAGWAYWRRLAANLGKWSGRSFDVYVAVKQGEASIGVAQAEEFGIRGKLEVPAAEFGYTYLDMNTMIPSPVEILAGAADIETGQKFLEFITSADGQRESIKVGFIPSRPDVKFSEVAATSQQAALMKATVGFDNVWEIASKLAPLDFALQAKRYSEVNKIFDDTIFTVSDKLKTAWLSIEKAQSELSDLKNKGYDVAAATSDLNAAMAAFDKANYDQAKSLADGAPAKAAAATVDALKSQVSTLQGQVASLSAQVAGLQNERIYYAAVAGIIGLVLGIGVGYSYRKRKEEA